MSIRSSIKLTGLFALLILSISVVCNAQTVTITTPNNQLTPKSVVTATVTITNSLIPRPDITLTAGGTYQDYLGVIQSIPSSSVTLKVIQPLTFNKLILSLPTSISYQAGSVTNATASYLNNVLTLDFGAVPPLIEGQKLTSTVNLVVN
jgi:hypothetical protein